MTAVAGQTQSKREQQAALRSIEANRQGDELQRTDGAMSSDTYNVSLIFKKGFRFTS
jgi:hypothetical protein